MNKSLAHTIHTNSNNNNNGKITRARKKQRDKTRADIFNVFFESENPYLENKSRFENIKCYNIKNM